MDASATSFSLSSLLCQETESSLNDSQEDCRCSDLNLCSVSESEEEYVQNLIQKESSFESDQCVPELVCRVLGESWLKCARSASVKWILNTSALFGFHFGTAYLSLIYFDRFLSKRSIDNGKMWAIRLLSVACVSLAAKMEECEVPSLSQYHMDDYNFESCVIERMELLVLNTLEWKMASITPFAYLHYFVAKFCLQNREFRPKELISGATELILAILKEINVKDVQPSVIAAAAVLAASHDELTMKTMEVKLSFISSIRKESVYSCFDLMKEIKKGKPKTPESVLSTNLNSINVFENSSFASAVGSKRRLTYTDCDLHCPLQKVHRT